MIAIFFEYIDQQDADERANQRLRTVLSQKAPAIRDAVIQGLAFKADDLAKVSSPQVLDRLARNVLAIQLGDRDLATNVYDDLRDQAIPASSVVRFACVSDMAEYRDLLRDPTIASVWYFGKPAGIDAASREAYELTEFAING